MNYTTAHFTQAISCVKKQTASPKIADLTREIIENGGSSRLLLELVSSEKQIDLNQESVVRQTMSVLESFADKAPDLACILMCDLWSLASDQFIHDVCDAIDLWIASCDSKELVGHLKELAKSESEPNKRKHFQQLLLNKV